MPRHRLVVSSHQSATVIDLLDQPPLGHLLALVLSKLEELGDDAFGYKILEALSADAGGFVDHAQVYNAIRNLKDRKPKPFIEQIEERPQAGSPPIKIYAITEAGKQALAQTSRHYAAVAAYLGRKRKRRA